MPKDVIPMRTQKISCIFVTQFVNGVDHGRREPTKLKLQLTCKSDTKIPKGNNLDQHVLGHDPCSAISPWSYPEAFLCNRLGHADVVEPGRPGLPIGSHGKKCKGPAPPGRIYRHAVFSFRSNSLRSLKSHNVNDCVSEMAFGSEVAKLHRL